MPRIRLPHNGWHPRSYQLGLWEYLEGGGKRAVAIWHRRSGKDETALHWTAIAAQLRVGNYWHMLPQSAQARKVIWESINPHSGKRRIDEAFPHEIRDNTRETDMLIRFKSGSVWQVVGSDNYNSLMGTPPIGITFSEYALADPNAWAYLRPILEENGGWAMFITTPRGRNHAHRMLELARSEPGWFGEVLSARQTPVFEPGQLDRIRREMCAEYGEDDGGALFDQEYGCSFDAPLVGSFYARLVGEAEQQGRIRSNLPYDPGYPVETAWDLGYSDDTTIWWYQVLPREVRILAAEHSHGQDIAYYCGRIQQVAKDNGWSYGDPLKARHWVPWDAAPKTLAAAGKSIVEQAWALGVRMWLVPNLSKEDGIQAVRHLLPRCWFDKDKCATGLEALRGYRREWDDERKVFKRTPLHSWESHYADAFRMLAVAWRTVREAPPPPPPPRGLGEITWDELMAHQDKKKRSGMI